jgi:hypothetical protein
MVVSGQINALAKKLKAALIVVPRCTVNKSVIFNELSRFSTLAITPISGTKLNIGT